MVKFQSRNRGSFDFKESDRDTVALNNRHKFQSRNRGSFDFKSEHHLVRAGCWASFNLQGGDTACHYLVSISQSRFF